MELVSGEINYIEKETLFLNKCNNLNTISLVLQGEVSPRGNGICKDIRAGHFIGIQGLIDQFEDISYLAKSDLTLRIFEASTMKEFIELFVQDNELQEDMFIELSTLILQLSEIYNLLYSQTQSLYQTVISIKKHYIQHCEKIGFPVVNLPIGKEIDSFILSDQNFYEDFILFNEVVESPEKAFALFQEGKNKILTKQLTTILNLYKLYLKLKSYTQRLTTVFVNKEEVSLIKLVTELAEFANTKNVDKTFLLRLLDTMSNLLKSTEEKLKKESNINLYIDYEFVGSCLSRANKSKKVYTNHHLNYPKNNLNNLMDYAGLDKDKQDIFTKLIDYFIHLKDKFSREETERNLYKQIAQIFYELYELVFFKSVSEPIQYHMVDLFLNFGFLDERLLTQDQINLLMNIDDFDDDEQPCQVYRMKDWLTNIYNGKETPSKNEFDEDYFEMVRRRKKQESLTNAQELALLNDSILKTKFEIQNMFRYNNRLINGNVLSFVPLLFNEVFETSFRNIIVDAKQINSCISSIVAIDFSLFYREMMYADENAKIEKELIQKEIYPLIVIFPVYGVNGIMWQETTRKRSDSQGRFFLPAITNVDLEEMLLKLLGKFRWELCKNQQGFSWNNIRVPSLTSEYSDYIQFYRKNRELSVAKKEMLKNQMTKCRNNIREIFISDYIAWIKFESTGSVRLNNVVRRILSTYCPFSKPIRENLFKQPLFNKAMFKFNHQREKKTKELHNRYTTLANHGVVITQELLDTQRFYNEL